MKHTTFSFNLDPATKSDGSTGYICKASGHIDGGPAEQMVATDIPDAQRILNDCFSAWKEIQNDEDDED